MIQIEQFTADDKALHENLTPAAAIDRLLHLSTDAFVQTDLFTTAGQYGVLVSSKGEIRVSVPGKPVDGDVVPPKVLMAAHDRQKRYLLDPVKNADFLSGLGVTDAKGRIFEKKHAKFRQINRFLELLDDVYEHLPADGPLTVYDLCCGKSYLTFAVYYYLTVLRGRTVDMTGVDLKPDVMAFCENLARRLSCTGLRFCCADIRTFLPKGRVDLVVSLHACDIATDFVLDFALRYGAGVILSTPCCHHEMMHTIHSERLSFITRHSMLKQKFCDAATDALRCLKLEAAGYAVETLELIDPEETPKNLMIRAHLPKVKDPVRMKLARPEYLSATAFLGTTPTLGLT